MFNYGALLLAWTRRWTSVSYDLICISLRLLLSYECLVECEGRVGVGEHDELRGHITALDGPKGRTFQFLLCCSFWVS